MHQDEERLDIGDARFGRKHETDFATLKKNWLEFDHNSASFVKSSEVQLDMPNVPCLKKQKYGGYLSTIVGFLEEVSG